MTDDEFNDYVEILNDDNFKGRTLHTPKSLVHQIYELNEKVKQLTRERDEALRRRIVYSPDAKALSDRADAAERKVEKLREALKAMLREHDILSENDPSVRRGTDRWPTSAGLARGALAETENNDD